MRRRAERTRPPEKLSASEWCGRNVNLVQGLTPRLDVSISPWMREPLDRIRDHKVKEMHWLWSPGGGKTTGVEGAIQWKMANAPSNVLLIGQKDDTAERWMETRFLPSVRKNPALKDLLPSSQGNERHKIRKTTVIFNHGFYFEAGGSAPSNLQEKSMPFVIFEEAWKTAEHPGRIEEGKQRTHDKWDALILYTGQAGRTHHDPDNDDTVSDLYREWRKTDQKTFCWECPDCSTVQPFKWDSLKYELAEEDGVVDWEATEETIHMACVNPECEATFKDTAKERRMLSESGRYVSQNDHPLAGHVGYHANALCYWRIPWAKLVRQWHEANEAKMRGDLSKLEIFVTKRLCEFWTPTPYEMEHELEVGSYNLADFANGELVDNEEDRCMAIDVQQNELWWTAAAVTGDGHVQVLDCGQLLTFDEAEETRKRFKIPPRCVLVDSQYRQDYVFQTCSKYGWTAYRGVFREYFNLNIQGEIRQVPYSKALPVQSGSGARTFCVNFCVNPIKDVVAEMRAGRMGSLMVPSDIDPRFKDHLNAEVKRRVVAGKERREQEMWVRIGKRDNHMLDNVMAIVGFGMIRRLIQSNS